MQELTCTKGCHDGMHIHIQIENMGKQVALEDLKEGLDWTEAFDWIEIVCTCMRCKKQIWFEDGWMA